VSTIGVFGDDIKEVILAEPVFVTAKDGGGFIRTEAVVPTGRDGAIGRGTCGAQGDAQDVGK